jgi:aarF domain-containing kinase
MFSTEFDYQVEAKNLRDVGSNMSKAGFDGVVVVPKPFDDLCAKNVLTMEFLEGPKLIDGIRKQLRDYARYKGVDPIKLEREMKEKMMREGLPPPYNGPSAFQLEVYRRLLASRDVLMNTCIWFGNGLLSLFSSARIGYVKSFIPLNSSKIMDTLLKVHGHQLLVNGVFNSDPHPGNFLLLKDGRIGMIDYGQVKRLSDDERIHLAELIHHLARNDVEAVVKKSIDLGYESKFYDRDIIFKVNQVVLDQDGRHITEGLNMQQYIDKLYAKDPWNKSADFMIMPVRLSLLLRGVGHMLNHPVSVATAWDPIAKHVMNSTN